MTPLERAAAWFITPPSAIARTAAAEFPPAARVVVLGGPPDVAPLAAAVALALRAPASLVALWRADRSIARGTATRAAARLVAQLASRDLPAVSRGRLAWLTLPDDSCEAAAAVRCASAIVDGTLVTGLAGARPAELEELVGEHDLGVIAADPDTPIARAALVRLAGRGIDAVACPAPPRGLPRRLALAGLVAPRLPAPFGTATGSTPAATEDA